MRKAFFSPHEISLCHFLAPGGTIYGRLVGLDKAALNYKKDPRKTLGKLGRPFLDAAKEFLDAPIGIDITNLRPNVILTAGLFTKINLEHVLKYTKAAALLISFGHWFVVFAFKS